MASTPNHLFSPPTLDLYDPRCSEEIKKRIRLNNGEDIRHIIQVKKQDTVLKHIVFTTWALRVIVNNWTEKERDHTIPLTTIYAIKKTGGKRTFGHYGITLKLTTGAYYFIKMNKDTTVRPGIIQILESHIAKAISPPLSVYMEENKWLEPLQRVSKWEIVDNDFCSTYYPRLLFPSTITHEVLSICADHRAGHRLPILSYMRSDSRAVLMRSSMPLKGINGASCPEDRNFVSQCVGVGKLTIFDLRPKVVSMASSIGGGGYENPEDYSLATVLFASIPNIHVVRKALRALKASLEPDSGKIDPKWGEITLQVLEASQEIAQLLYTQTSVLIHCSDGWDRTAQVASLVQIMLEPECRTVHGMLTLIQKEWQDAGHKFKTRYGYPPIQDKQELSPVFIQFLDCVSQLLLIYPMAFEFNSHFLSFLAYNTYSMLYGDFYGDSYTERIAMNRPKPMSSALEDPALMNLIKNENFIPQTTPINRKIKVHQLNYDLLAPPVYGSFSDGPASLCGF